MIIDHNLNYQSYYGNWLVNSITTAPTTFEIIFIQGVTIILTKDNELREFILDNRNHDFTLDNENRIFKI